MTEFHALKMIVEHPKLSLQTSNDNKAQCRNKLVKLFKGSACEGLTESKGRREGRVAGLGQHSVGFWPRETHKEPTSEHMLVIFRNSDDFTIV